MADDKERDFEVISSANVPGRVFRIFNDFKNNIKPAVLAGRVPDEQGREAFLLNAAIRASSLAGALYRKSDSANDALAVLWLSLVKQRAQKAVIENKVHEFKGLDLDELNAFVRLSADPTSISQLASVLAAHHGVILVVEEYFPGMKLDGCVFRLSSGTPVVGLSVRYNRYDNFWFTLAHELAHVVLHYDLLETPIMDDLENGNDSDVEVEANRLASDSLIPRDFFRKILLSQDSYEKLFELSERAQTHPSIAAGMVRHKTGQWGRYADLVKFMDVRKELGIS